MSEGNTYRCGCNYVSELGVTICRGCQSAIVYGATVTEVGLGRNQGVAIAVVITVLLLEVLPMALNLQFQWHIPLSWGLGYFAIPAIIAAAFWGGYIGTARVLDAKRGLIRSFPRR